jgi:hypothetical protein
MDLEPGTRFRLFRSERMYEVAGFGPGRKGGTPPARPDARVLVRLVGSQRVPTGHGEARRSVERWVLRELDRGGWPWPGPPVYVFGQSEPAGWLLSDVVLDAQQRAARQVGLDTHFHVARDGAVTQHLEL